MRLLPFSGVTCQNSWRKFFNSALIIVIFLNLLSERVAAGWAAILQQAAGCFRMPPPIIRRWGRAPGERKLNPEVKSSVWYWKALERHAGNFCLVWSKLQVLNLQGTRACFGLGWIVQPPLSVYFLLYYIFFLSLGYMLSLTHFSCCLSTESSPSHIKF